MKKILFSLLAVAALASCMKEQTLSVAEGSRIGFAGSFVENATRAAANPSTTTENIEEFFVWGVMDNETGVVFDDERVYKANAGWTYDETQYWTPNHTYYFSALAGDRSNDQIVLDLASAADNGMSVDGLGTLTFTNVEGVNDVLYSESTRTTGASITSQPADVKFQFNHLLSKVKFSFTNGFVNQNNAIIVKNIKMYVPKTGVIDLTKDAYEWTDHAGETVLDMGNINAGANVLAGASASSDNERLTIPAAATQEYTVTFDVELYMGAVLASSASKTVKIEGCLLEPGKGYNFKAILNEQNVDENPLFPITFDAEVDEWDEWYDYDGGVLADNTYVVYTRDELQAVLDAANMAGENVKAVFGADIEGNVTVYELPNLTNIIDGNNFKFNGCFFINGKTEYKNSTTVFENINFETADQSTFTGDAFIYCNEQTGNTRYPDNVTIKNCSFTATGAAEKLTVGAKFRSINGNFVVENCKASGLHSLAQLLSCGKAVATFDNVTIANSKNGISLEKTGKTTISNSDISTDAYGVRADGCAANTVILDTDISSKQPVIVRNVTVAGYVLNIDEASVLTPATEGDYEVIFTQKSDDKEYVAPAVEFTYNVPAYYKVFPASVGVTVVSDATGLTTALAAEAPTVMLMPGTYEGTFKPSAPVTIKSVYPENKAVIAGRVNANVDCSFENIKFTVTEASKETGAFSGTNYQYPAIVTIYAAATSFEGCEFETKRGTVSVTSINYGSHVPGKMLTVNNCSFVGDFYAIRTRTLFSVTNSTFNIHTDATLAAVFTWGNSNSGADKVTFTGNENTSGYETMGTMFSSTTFTYDNIHVNIQGNTGFSAFKDSVNPACTVTGLTYASGSESL